MENIRKLTELLRNHHRIVFFGGAGVSTESMIPDFRGKDGLYRKKTDWSWTPEEMLSHHFFEEHPREFFEMYRKMAEGIAAAKPNKAHEALAALERMGKLTAVVTQNIDGLHQKAGSRNVIELHGTSLTNTCLDCGKNISLDDFLAQKETIPHCPCCGGMLRPDIILYEEALDMDVIDDAATAISQADLLIIGGTSLVVYPAAGMVRYFGGDAKVMINRDPTERDEECDLVFRESIGKVLDEAVRGMKEI